MSGPPLPWLAEPWQRVARALGAGRLPAGLLILGRPGLGRVRLATAISAARLCPEATPEGGACGVCRACRQVAAGTHPDLLRVEPEAAGQALRVDQIRELARALSLTPGRQGARCAIVAPADRLTAAAANALLKTLEEPPAGATLILVAAAAGALPATVVSRCLRLPVAVPEPAAALDWLSRRAPREDWPAFIALAGGAPLAALALAEVWPEGPHPTLRALTAAAAGEADPLAVAEACGSETPQRLAEVIGWLAQGALRARSGAGAPAAQWPQQLQELARHGDPRALARLWHAARAVAADAAALNPALARERLILLFVNAFAPPSAAGREGAG